jgi:hypothetical protein
VRKRPTWRKGPASAGPLRVLAVIGVAAMVASPACKVGNAHPKTASGLPKGMAAKPLPLSPSETSSTVPGDPGSGTTASSTGRGGTTTTARSTKTTGSAGPATTTPPAPFHGVATVADAANDAGLQTQPYGDITALRLEDNGAQARFTVEMRGDVPAKLGSGETMGVGVDIYRGHAESDFQLFADGSSDGWFAYYEAGSGFKPFPGYFEQGANRLVFVVDWAAIGGHSPGAFSAFADWSKTATAVLASASEDHAPDNGTSPFSP